MRDSAKQCLGNQICRTWEVHTPRGSSTEEQRSQAASCAKTLRVAGLSVLACVGSAVTARCGDVPTSPPWPNPKSHAAAPRAIFRQALKAEVAHAAAIRPARRAFEVGDELHGASLRRAAMVALRKQCPPGKSRASGRRAFCRRQVFPPRSTRWATSDGAKQ